MLRSRAAGRDGPARTDANCGNDSRRQKPITDYRTPAPEEKPLRTTTTGAAAPTGRQSASAQARQKGSAPSDFAFAPAEAQARPMRRRRRKGLPTSCARRKSASSPQNRPSEKARKFFARYPCARTRLQRPYRGQAPQPAVDAGVGVAHAAPSAEAIWRGQIQRLAHRGSYQGNRTLGAGKTLVNCVEGGLVPAGAESFAANALFEGSVPLKNVRGHAAKGRGDFRRGTLANAAGVLGKSYISQGVIARCRFVGTELPLRRLLPG